MSKTDRVAGDSDVHTIYLTVVFVTALDSGGRMNDADVVGTTAKSSQEIARLAVEKGLAGVVL